MSEYRTQQIMVRLKPADYAALKKHAEETERTIAQTVRLAVRNYLAALKEQP